MMNASTPIRAMAVAAVVSVMAVHGAGGVTTPHQRIILHGMDCGSGEDCREARAVMDEALRVISDTALPVTIRTLNAQTVRAYLTAGGIERSAFAIEELPVHEAECLAMSSVCR